MIKISVPARICFYGDHQDYLGLPVIAGAIDRFIHIVATPYGQARFSIALKNLGRTENIDLDDALDEIADGDYFRSAMAVLKQKGLVLNQGYQLEIFSNIPVNAGLSSSSALIVAWIRFLLASQKFPGKPTDKQIGHWAYEAEVLYFNQPGGLMDQYTIAQRGLIFIDTKKGESTRLNPKLGEMVVAESGLPKRTLDVLKNARVYAQKAIKAVKDYQTGFDMEKAQPEDYERFKSIVPEKYHNHWYAAVYNYHITLKAKEELSRDNPNLKVLGDLMNQHQAILQKQIQNTPDQMIRMMEAAKKAGALGTKIIGSGGGGCMVALVEQGTKEKIIEAFLDNGAKDAYPVNLTT